MPSATNRDLMWDVTLVVGEDQARIAASSQVLRMASKPFFKMLGPDFKEGQLDEASTKKDVSLPADKPSAIELMCNIMHHQVSGVSTVPTVADLYDLAIVAGKYDCTFATGLAARAWIKPTSAHDMNDLGLLLVSAFIYTLQDTFHDISALLVLGHEGSYGELEKVPGFIERLGWETILRLEEKRSSVRQMVNKELVLSLALPSCSWKCDWSSQQLRRWFEHLQQANLLPVEESEKPANAISRAECSAISDTVSHTRCESARWHRRVDTGMRNRALADMRKSSGISL